jgi:hypothetical protein
MLEQYLGWYSDSFGNEEVIIKNDGTTLTMLLRGVEFETNWIEDWEPKHKTVDTENVLLPLKPTVFSDSFVLENFVLDFLIPVLVVSPMTTINANLCVHFETNPSGSIWLDLDYASQQYRSKGRNFDFEEMLLAIQKDLPTSTYIKSCFNCAYSDYNPVGKPFFGGMMCFRTCKEKYLSKKGKNAVFGCQDDFAGFVQETFCCPEFEKRKPNTGYRG